MTPKQSLHKLIDELPESEVSAAFRFLQYLKTTGTDPVLRAFVEAPQDDEPLTAEELDAVREADEAITRGDEVSHRKVSRGSKK